MRARVAALLAACVPLLLTECSYDITCDRTSAVIVLPEPGDKIVLRGRVCVEGAAWMRPFGVHVLQEVSPPLVQLSIVDPALGSIVVTNGWASVELAPVHCSEGLDIMIESTSPPGSEVTATLELRAEAEEYERCEVALEGL